MRTITVVGGLVQDATGGPVALADQEAIPASRLLGRGSGGGSGVPETIVLGANLSLSGNVLSSSGGGGGVDGFSAENKDVVTIKAGQPVATHSSGTGVVLAAGTASGLACVGLASEDIAPAAAGLIQTGGPLTISDWTDGTGSASLSSRTTYYLSTAGGLITSTSPTSAGEYSQVVGRSVGVNTLAIEIASPILL